MIFNETIRKWVCYEDETCEKVIRCVVYISVKYIEYGYVDSNSRYVTAICPDGAYYNVLINDNNIKYLSFDRRSGYYKIHCEDSLKDFFYGNGDFPYSFNRCYSTRYLENFFEKNIKNIEKIQFKYINELPYTFGLEFETAAGYMPEIETIENGLIPLRDGSITGLEYSTIVLNGNFGFNLLKRQTELLKKYTIFDKDCSLHLHIGGFKLDPAILLMVNNLFSYSNISNYLPVHAFNTDLFKTNGKNYCAKNKTYRDFNSLYYDLVGTQFYGDLYQPHPKDLSGDRKWNITTRYKAVNLVNAICYNNAKTIEFRFMHPNYNFDRLICWIFVLAAFVKYAETYSVIESNLCTIIRNVYSSELSSILLNMLSLQQDVVKAQYLVRDPSGQRVDIENEIMTYDNLKTNNLFFY